MKIKVAVLGKNLYNNEVAEGVLPPEATIRNIVENSMFFDKRTDIHLNGKPATLETKLKAGDVVVFTVPSSYIKR